MTVSEDRIVKLLASEWQEGLRITTIPQAMARLGVSDDEEVRWRIVRLVERLWWGRLGWRSLWRGLRWLRGFLESDTYGSLDQKQEFVRLAAGLARRYGHIPLERLIEETYSKFPSFAERSLIKDKVLSRIRKRVRA